MLEEHLIPSVIISISIPKFSFYKCISTIVYTILILSCCFLYLHHNHARPKLHQEVSVKRSLEADFAAVATDEGRCSDIGLNVIKEGGNAVDSAVAVSFCLGVLNPMASGIGGGNFMLIRLSNGSALFIDGRETAPLASFEDMYNQTNSSSTNGPLSVAVPGELAALFRAWQMYGRMRWHDLVAPAVTLAGEGFVVSKYLEASLKRFPENVLADPGLRSVFAPRGSLLLTGELCRNPQLAKTLQAVAENGPSVLYGGEVGKKLVREVQEMGGILSLQDLLEYREEIKEPISGRALGMTFLGVPPPSGGSPAVIQILKILEGFSLSSSPLDVLSLHRTVEAMKHAFALRMDLGDPKFVNNSDVLIDMLSSSFASLLRLNISDSRTFPPSHYGGRYNQLNDNGTSHFVIVDGERNAVSVTSTVNTAFGSKILSKSTGILLNNEMDDFSKPGEKNVFNLPPAKKNFIRPGKRPLSSMGPFIVLQKGRLRAVVGGSGGPFIISAVAQVLVNYFVKKMTPLEAIQSPRVHHQVSH